MDISEFAGACGDCARSGSALGRKQPRRGAVAVLEIARDRDFVKRFGARADSPV